MPYIHDPQSPNITVQSQYVNITRQINYISEFKKILVGRNNQTATQKFKIDNRISQYYYFQIVNRNNQIVIFDDDFIYEFFGSFVDARNQMHVVFFSDDFTITSDNQLRFKVNTFTSEYLYNIKRPKQIEITIKKRNNDRSFEKVILRDSGIAYPCPAEPGVEPTPVVAGWNLNLNGYVLSLNKEISGSISLGFGNSVYEADVINDQAPSIAIGSYLQAPFSGQTVVGNFNQPVEDAVFIIGNGSYDFDNLSANFSNALVVMNDGDISGGTFYSNGVRLATIDEVPSGGGATYTAGEGIGISDQNVISLTATIPSSMEQLDGYTHYITGLIPQNSISSLFCGNSLYKVGINYDSLHNAGFAYTSAIPISTSQLTNDSDFITNSDLTGYATKTELETVSGAIPTSYVTSSDLNNYATTGALDTVSAAIPLSTSQLTNDSDFITSSALTGISTDKLQKIVIDSTVQDSGYVMQYDPTADVVYNTIATNNGLLTLNVVSGFENDIEVGKAATFENWVKVQGNLTGVAVGQGLKLIGELPEEFNSNNTQVFSRRIARLNKDTTVQQISYNYDFYETPVPLTLKSNGSTTVTLSAAGSPDAVTLSSRINDGEWTSYSVGNAITLNDGDEVSFKGINDHFSKTSNDKYTFVVEGDGTVEAFGSVKSLIGEDSTMNNYCFTKLFHSCAKLTDASKLVLPDKDLSQACFRNMFYMCTGLTGAPEVKAIQLPNDACAYMFSNCQSLVSAPDLHVLSAANQACQQMFGYDYALTAAPALPVERIGNKAFINMFNSCSSMVTAPAVIPATRVDNNGCEAMFANCTALTSAPQLPATSVYGACYQRMFSGCVNLVTGPSILPATGLASYCYDSMFRGCTHLTDGPSLPAKTMSDYCYSSMFRGCSSLSSISVGFTAWDQVTYQTYKWLDGVAANGVFNKPYDLPVSTGVNYIPQGWSTGISEFTSCPLMFEAVDDSVNIQLNNSDDPNTVSLYYNVNDTGWQSMTTNSDISLAAGDKIAISGDNSSGFNNSENSPYKFTASGNGKLKLYGNIMSLLTSSFESATDFSFISDSYYVFQYLFQGMDNLVDASNLILPVTDLSNNGGYQYQFMFNNCQYLTAAPQLPATKVGSFSYYFMFDSCRALSTAPQLPATTVGYYSYSYMFESCASLTSIPVLPAKTIDEGSYDHMFTACGSLTSVDNIAATTLQTECFSCMFYGCINLSSININFTDWGYCGGWTYDVAANGTFYKPATLTEQYGQDYIPQGWTVIDK